MIASLTWAREDETFARPVGHATLAVPQRPRAVVTLTDAAGRAAHGEAAPLPGYSSDTLDAVCATLDALATAPAGPVVLHIDPAWPPSLRFALEWALFQLDPQALPALAARPRRVVDVNAMLGPALDPSIDARAARKVAAGFTTLKLKVGAPGRWHDEHRALCRLAQRHPAVTWRLDANGAWSPELARRALAMLHGLRVDVVEEPLSGEALLALDAGPWAADESLSLPGFAARLAGAPRGCKALVLKPTLHGVSGCLALDAYARAAGLGVIVTHCFEGPVGRRGVRALAERLGAPGWAQGIDEDRD